MVEVNWQYFVVMENRKFPYMTYGIEPLCTLIKSRPFYTKTYGIEPYHVLSILWWEIFLLSPDVGAMCEEHILRVIIFIVPVIGRYIPFMFLWWQSYFACIVVVFYSSSTHSRGEWIDSAVFWPLPVCTISLYDSLFFTVLDPFASSDVTPTILSLLLFLYTSYSWSTSVFVISPLKSLKILHCFGLFRTSAHIFSMEKY